jgi:hypothetical protein
MNEEIKLYNVMLDDRLLAFSNRTKFEVQIGKGEKGSYKTIASFYGDRFEAALIHYSGMNIGNGYKKRLISNDLNKPVLARQFS